MAHRALHQSAGQLSPRLLHRELHPPAHEPLQSPCLPAETAKFLNTLHGFLPGNFPRTSQAPSSPCKKIPGLYVELMLILSLALDICHYKPCLLGGFSALIKITDMFEIKYSQACHNAPSSAAFSQVVTILGVL